MNEHLNAQSLLSSIHEVKILIEDRNVDVLCVTETWLLPHTPDNYINMSNYKIFRCDGGRGAGTCIYVRDTLKVNTITLDIPRPSDIEDIWIAVQCCRLPSIIIGCMYRHPKALAVTFDYIEDDFRLFSVSGKSLLF